MSDTPNPYQTPLSAPEISGDQGSVIDQLPVSETWKKRFRLIEAAGGEKITAAAAKQLTFGQRFSMTFNVLAFLFGPIYFLIKGMWRPAVLYFVSYAVLATLFIMLGWENILNGLSIGFAAAFMGRANILYYKKMVLGKEDWI